MEKRIVLTILVLLAVSGFAPAATSPSQADYVENQIIVKFRRTVTDTLETKLPEGISASELEISASLDRLNKKYRLRKAKPLFKNFRKNRQHLNALLKKDRALLTKKEERILRRLKRAPRGAKVPELDRIYKIDLDLEPDQSLEDAVAAYNADPDVEYAELNYIVSICRTPNDPLYPIQWPLNNTGQIYPESGYYTTPPGIPDCDIDAPEAWDIHTGSSEVIVAVVDTGVDYTHRDLDDNMWTNVNGYYGYDFINNDNNPMDDHGHGTHCSGIVTAEGNNGLDITGLCWNAKIMALKFLGANGSGSGADAVEAFYYAVNNGADVVSNSWGGGGYMQSMQDAINYAYSQGVIMIASAGNNGFNGTTYPACYDNMIAVAATNSNDEKASFSNYGDWVDIAAPGVDVLSLRANGTSMGSPYDSYTTIASGTSMSCPYVAGVAALIISNSPEASLQKVTTRLILTADDISNKSLGTGRLNAYKAIREKFEGVITFDADLYLCDDIVSIKLFELDLIGETTQQITITADGGDEETVMLVANVETPWAFTGIININTDSVTIGDGMLEVSHGQIVTATYYDTDNGEGSPATSEAIARIDCQGPVISNIEVVYTSISRAMLSFETDEPTTARTRCDESCGGDYLIFEEDPTLTTSHTLILSGLTSETDYYFVIDAEDILGNATTDDNGGVCYSFATKPTPTPLLVPSEFSTIQVAINAAGTDDTIIVADGTYTGVGNRDINFSRKAVTLQSENGPENCIIDCQGTETEKHRAFSGLGNNSVLDGFTITNSYHDEGAIYLDADPTITNCIISNNSGLYAGGIYGTRGCGATIENCIISGNSSANEGGGIKTGSSESHITISNCIISDNRAAYGGAIMWGSWEGTITMTNCVVVDNATSVWNSAIWLHNNCMGTITNCIVRNNSGGQISTTGRAIAAVTYSNIESSWAGEGNIDIDPMFVNAQEGDYHLLTGSPCIDAGDPEFISEWNETDMDGDPRILSGRVDIGVDEYNDNVRPVADAGQDQSMSVIPAQIILDGSGSYSTDGDTLNYHWEQIDGPMVELSDANAVKPTFVPFEFGIYVFRLIVDDRIDDSFADTVGIVVGNNHAPVADAGPDRYAASELALEGTSSYDPDGYGALTYQWQQISGPTTVINNANTAKPTISFTQTSRIQECQFQLVVSDGDLTSTPDTVKVIVVPSFGDNVLELFNPPFDPDKPTIIAFGSFANYVCSLGSGLWMYSHTAQWVTRPNFVTLRGSSPVPYSSPYERYGDMFITYLSSVAPDYKQPIQSIGYRTGGTPAIDVANHINMTYKDSRYAVNRVTLLGATCRDYTTDITTFNNSRVDGEQCWVDNYYLMDGGIYPGGDSYPGALNVYFATDDNILVRGWYEGSLNHITWPDYDMYRHGLTAGGPVSVVGVCKNLQLANDITNYYFEWYKEDPYCSGINCPQPYLVFYDVSLYPGQLPEPVTLIGPKDGTVLDANGVVLSCEASENAIGYQLLFGSDQYRVQDYNVISDTPSPPNEIITELPFKETRWTVRAYDLYGSTIHADSRLIRVIPIAVAGPNQIVYSGKDDIAEVVLDGSCSYAAYDGYQLSYLWAWTIDGNNYDANGVGPTIELPIGQHTIELIVNDGIDDSEQDEVTITVVPPIEVPMKFTPQALNLSSGGKLLKAHFVLPEGFSVEDVDVDTPAVIEPFGVESYKIKVFLNDEGLVRVEATFSRSDLCASITGYDRNTEVMVIGRLTTGRYFYGTDTIKITDRAFDSLAVLVSHWLEAECSRPDWCGGADLNHDSVVNFLDFALLNP